MVAFSALLALCVWNSPVTGEFPVQRPVTRSFDVFFDLRLNKRLSKQLWGNRAHYDVTVVDCDMCNLLYEIHNWWVDGLVKIYTDNGLVPPDITCANADLLSVIRIGTFLWTWFYS